MKSTLARSVEHIDFLDWYRRNRERSTQLFDMIDPQAHLARPIPLRHPILFYEGHLPAFSFITLSRDTLGHASVDRRFEVLFQRGIDPSDTRAAAAQSIASWPSRDEVIAFGRKCDEAVEAGLRQAQTSTDERTVMAAYTILEHEQMHHETLLYIFHRLPRELKKSPFDGAAPARGTLAKAERIRILAGSATLGAKRSSVPFGWDNEFDEVRVDVPAFEIDALNVTNGDYLAFVRDGGPMPPFWIERGGRIFVQGMFEDVELPESRPVYTTLDQAMAFAAWRGARLPSEAEYHRAAFGTPEGSERAFPWGEEQPSARPGNFDFRRWDPEPVGAYPENASAWGVHDMVGNGWEWTLSPFEPFPGFAPMITYRQYSADFFDGQHFVVKGASPVTARELIRRSLRNWYRPNYPYIYAKFRCVE